MCTYHLTRLDLFKTNALAYLYLGHCCEKLKNCPTGSEALVAGESVFSDTTGHEQVSTSSFELTL